MPVIPSTSSLFPLLRAFSVRPTAALAVVSSAWLLFLPTFCPLFCLPAPKVSFIRQEA